MKAKLCKCNNCDTVMIDQNPKTDTPELEVPDNATDMQFIDEEGGGYWGCPVCDDDGYLMDITEQSQLPSTPVDEVKDKHTDISELKQMTLNKCDEALKLNSGIGNFGAPDKHTETKQPLYKVLKNEIELVDKYTIGNLYLNSIDGDNAIVSDENGFIMEAPTESYGKYTALAINNLASLAYVLTAAITVFKSNSNNEIEKETISKMEQALSRIS